MRSRGCCLRISILTKPVDDLIDDQKKRSTSLWFGGRVDQTRNLVCAEDPPAPDRISRRRHSSRAYSNADDCMNPDKGIPFRPSFAIHDHMYARSIPRPDQDQMKKPAEV